MVVAVKAPPQCMAVIGWIARNMDSTVVEAWIVLIERDWREMSKSPQLVQLGISCQLAVSRCFCGL
jgi:hypothetical protein